MKIIVTTMVYNEGLRLKRWIDYYGRQLGLDSLLIIDHGSTDGSTEKMNVGRLLLPRSEFDDIQRAEFISDLSKSLLRYYDVMIYIDCDEIIVADPSRYESLRAYLELAQSKSIRPIGFDVFHVRHCEPALAVDRPIFQQRRHCWFRSTLCKPAIAFKPVRWVPGFHHCSEMSFIDTELYLFHLKQVDYEYALKRMELTRNLEWSERSISGGMGAHQRLSDQDMTRLQFETPESILNSQGVKSFSSEKFELEVAGLKEKLTLIHGIYRCTPYSGAVYEIPERMRGIL